MRQCIGAVDDVRRFTSRATITYSVRDSYPPKHLGGGWNCAENLSSRSRRLRACVKSDGDIGSEQCCQRLYLTDTALTGSQKG